MKLTLINHHVKGEQTIKATWNGFKKNLPSNGFWLPKRPKKNCLYDLRHISHRYYTDTNIPYVMNWGGAER